MNIKNHCLYVVFDKITKKELIKYCFANTIENRDIETIKSKVIPVVSSLLNLKSTSIGVRKATKQEAKTYFLKIKLRNL